MSVLYQLQDSSCQFMQLKYILLTVVIILVRLPFVYLIRCKLLREEQVVSRGQGVKREENRKFIIKEARTLTSGSLTGHIREAV